MKYAFFFLLAVWLVACSSAPAATPTLAPLPTATPKPASGPVSDQPLVSSVKPGNWSGTGDNNFAISFAVDDSGSTIAKGIQVTYKATCGSNATNVTETLAATDTLAFKSGELKFTNANYEITGRAVAADRIEGTLKAQGVRIGRLGECGTTPVNWTAAPK